MTQGRVARIAPLVEELREFCIGHEEGDGGIAAARMLGDVRDLWPDIPEAVISGDADAENDPEALVLRIIHDVGETAERLQKLAEDEALGWSRANLIVDLERYLDSLIRR